MRCYVDENECVGCETCVEIADDIFRMNDDGKAVAYGEVTDANKDKAQEAIDSCPVTAISWEE